ncbi:MAG: tetratricopeptide repeat protein [Desulfobacterales bacterium]|nr:tetratricopeptide repeat protein [Desulfobacterales bacterium]
MENKIKNPAIMILLAFILAAAWGCSSKKLPPVEPKAPPPQREKLETSKPAVSPVQPPAPLRPEPPEPVKQDPRMLAAANLVEQGRTYLDGGKPDQAIDVLERALSVDPSNGRTYYYMAEAWIMKKNKPQAMEFNRLATMYLSEDRHWAGKSADQKRRIQSMP